MAIIQTIRDKYAKVAGGVVVLALVGFIIGGSDVRNIFGPSTTLASINGEKIDIKEYDQLLNKYTEQYKINNKLSSLDEETDARLKSQIWDEIVKDRLLENVYDKLGIVVSKAELEDLISGDFLDPIIKQQFTNPQTGAVDRVSLEQNISNFRSNPDYKADWNAFQEDIIKRRKQAKFTNLVSGSIYMPKFLLDDENTAKNSIASINYVQLPYSLIPDSEVKTTDEELKAYINKYPKKFASKQDLRGIEYVSFNIVPNAEDSAQVINSINDIKDNFASITNSDSLNEFVSFNSSIQGIPSYVTKEQLAQLPNSEELWNAPINTVVGPFFDANYVNIAKVTDRANLPDSVKYRHIVVISENGGQAVRSDAEAKAKIDSAITMLNSGIEFDSVAVTYSDDQGILQNGGSYTNTLRDKTSLPKEVGTFLFSGKTGDKKLIPLEQGQFKGYQYIEILSQSAPINTIKIAVISKDLTPSSEAYSQAYANATQFLKKATESKDFQKTGNESNTSVLPSGNIAKNSALIPGIGASRELAKWIYTAKVNDISPIVTVGDKYVVAKLTSIQEKDKIELNETNKQSVEFLVKKEKKAKMLMEQSKGLATLEAISSKFNQSVGISEGINLSNPFAPSLGNEPRVVGFVFNKDLAINTLSKAIPGNGGIYFINVSSKQVNQVSDEARNIANERRLMLSPIQASISNQVINSLLDKADIKDNREKFY
jgi:peptidyl-prolyl cis-trans isomerase D